MNKKISKLFIANRGEICRRVALSAKRLQIKTAAIASDHIPQYLSPLIDDFLYVREETPTLYLDGGQLIAIAQQKGCDSIHPGFGFLSENADFAQQCLDAGLNWIGPTPESMRAMANKSKAKELAVKHGVPIIEGLDHLNLKNEQRDLNLVLKFVEKVGFPILIKAAMGGGGKGMRIVHSKEQLKDSLLRAHSEAKNSFADGTLIVERFFEESRHVEIQILGDKFGNIVALGDRDCSCQRRNQKIIEEAPAPQLSDKTRLLMKEAALKLAQAVQYESAGTIEFLVDWSRSSQKKEAQPFYFLEMNTRLQVEHPVTEEIFQLDLVAEQLGIAQGQKLDPGLSDIKSHGHSIELRIYAEDYKNNFFPAPGTVFAFKPAVLAGIRWEVGIDDQDYISGKFDPMIAKVISSGTTRDDALKNLNLAIEQTLFAGPANNLEFLKEIISNSEFTKGAISTGFINNHLQNILGQIEQKKSALIPLADQLFDAVRKINTQAQTSELDEIKNITKNAYNNSDVGTTDSTKFIRKVYTTEINKPEYYQCAWGSLSTSENRQNCYFVKAANSHKTMLILNIYGWQYSKVLTRKSLDNIIAPDLWRPEVMAPVPGKVVAICVDKGDNIRSMQTLFVLESMKMEFEIKAENNAKIKTIKVKVGDQVAAGDFLADLEIME